jgi:hypothetical protein
LKIVLCKDGGEAVDINVSFMANSNADIYFMEINGCKGVSILKMHLR